MNMQGNIVQMNLLHQLHITHRAEVHWQCLVSKYRLFRVLDDQAPDYSSLKQKRHHSINRYSSGAPASTYCFLHCKEKQTVKIWR
jgi:hypothetical protein